MKNQDRITKARAVGAKKYGQQSVNVGGHHYRLDTVPTTSLMLDYKLGIGGFPYGHAVEVYGANKIGKSSALGYGVLGNVIRQGKVPALLCSEPRMVTPGDREWGLKMGFDPDQAVIWYPDHAEEAFDMLRELVFNDWVDYIMIDSLGGMGNESSAKEDGKTKAYGISGEVTAGLNSLMPRLYKNNIGLLIINQQRQGGSARPGVTYYESPGGEALHHHMRIRIQVKPGSEKFNATIDGENVRVGQEIICKMIKNNMSQGQEKEATFNFFHIDTEERGLGIDATQDVINVGMITGVIQKAGSWYKHPSFPKEAGLHGKDPVGEFLRDNPEAYEQIRQGVLEVMVTKELRAAKEKREAELTAKVTNENSHSSD